ncbi:MAG: chromosome segregation protein [Phycisphaerales bacterium]|jgi:chromosome segregation protein|nr:chromosome segregation protein [Phycisphaerales bacterium]
MRLKKLILQGFKSFADRTEFLFDSPITGIVGPNGCGKSNVVDGFKWVLGEQSAKSLRGDAMMDVIFNGSGGRKPAGMAEVVLIFENPRREDNTRLLNLDTDEVSVGRRLFRDGTSEYQVNNQSSRLKDIKELFLDTGVGVDAYSVIEQGRVAALLEANPAERRLIFEEAAGISKYKLKKKEAQRKLEKVDQNLLRVKDITDEVDKRLRSVKIQAGRARTFQEYSTRLAELRLTYSIHDYHTQYQQSAELKSKLEDAQFRLDDLAQDLARKQNELAEKRQQHDDLTQKRQKLEYELVQAKAAMQSAQQRQQYAAEQLQQIAEQIAAFERDRAEAQAKLEEVTRSLASESESLQRLTEELAAQQRHIEQRQESFRDGQLELNELTKQIEQNKSAILDLMRKLANTNSRIGAIEIERKNIAAQQQKLTERRQIILGEISALDAQRSEASEKLQVVLAAIEEQQGQLESKRGEAQQLSKQIQQVGENLGAAKEHRSGLISRQKLLKDLEARREGVSEGVKSVLRQRDQKFPFIRGLVADVLRVDVEHAHAIEAALNGRDQYLVAADVDATIASREAFDDLEGRVNVLRINGNGAGFSRGTGASPVQQSRSDEFEDRSAQTHGRGAHATDDAAGYDWNQHPQSIRLAIDLVKFEPADEPVARHLLGRTVLVDRLDDAVALQKSGPKEYRYVTRAGEVIEADGTLRTGPLTAAMGLLSRRSELEAITLQVADVDHRIQVLSGELSHSNAEAKALEEQIGELRNTIYQSNTSKVELTSQIAQIGDKQSSLQRELPVVERELSILLDQVGKLKTEEDELAEQRRQFEADQVFHQQVVADTTARHAQVAEDLKLWGEQLTAARVALGQVQEKQLASQQHVQRQTAARAELEQQIARIIKSADSVAARRGGVERELQEAQRVEAQLLEQQQTLATQVEELASLLQQGGEVLKQLSSSVDSLRGEHGEIEQQVHQLQMRENELRIRLEALVQRTQDELQLNLPEKYAEHEAAGGYQAADMDWDAVANEIKELREKIQRLGNVNLDAIGELDELEQRSTFLANQVNDLTTSKLQLEQLIEEMNIESGQKFEETFNAVREHFQGMFRKLFGGGKADVFLELEVEEKQKIETEDGKTAYQTVLRKVDPLEAGIEVIARPPGKQPVSISQLSGGEKAMTCIALLMSIFKSKPSPFCILDEVDAPLDEANNQRFGLIVQEFLEMSQFIIITHHKRTMQIADVLYGVTMQEQGVSKRVAVKFDQVDAQGRISEHAAA